MKIQNCIYYLLGRNYNFISPIKKNYYENQDLINVKYPLNFNIKKEAKKNNTCSKNLGISCLEVHF
jgi:hypothetical protein